MSKSLVRLDDSTIDYTSTSYLVRRAIGNEKLTDVDPFLVLDHADPYPFEKHEAFGAADHPHKGFAALTYLIEGQGCHIDSLGNYNSIEAGDLQLLNAGNGIVHCELPSDQFYEKGGKMEAFQLWINIPKDKRQQKPSYTHKPSEQFHKIEPNVNVKILLGTFNNIQGTIIPPDGTMTTLIDLHILSNTKTNLHIGKGMSTFLYVWKGSGFVTQAEMSINQYQNAVLSLNGEHLQISTKTNEFRAILGFGKPICEPYVKNILFVMSNQEEIEQAYEDYRQGKFGTIEGKNERVNKSEKSQMIYKLRLSKLCK